MSKLTKIERLILLNQYDILAKLDPQGKDHYEKVREILESGYEFHYHQLFDHIGDEFPEDYQAEVFDTLDMFEVIGDSYKALQDKDGIDPMRVRFWGYDGNTEGAWLGYINFLVEKDDRYTHVIDSKRQNSHVPCRYRYGEMLRRFKAIGSPRLLNRQQLIDLINAT